MPVKKKRVAAKKPKAPIKRAAQPLAKARAVKVAAALVSGASVSKIARLERKSRGWASAHANSPEVQQMIASLCNSERARMHRLFVKALDVIEQAYKANSYAIVKGVPVKTGADHYARLTGAKRFLEFANAGRAQGREAETQDTRPITIADIKRAIDEEKKESIQ